MKWTQSDIAAALGSEPLQATANDWHAAGVSIDSRTIQKGELFVCVRGDTTDGHRYIDNALDKGASGLIVEQESLASGSIELPGPASGIAIFQVPDGIGALQDLARFHRGRLRTKIIAVTGSNGKTSTKDMLRGVLSHIVGEGHVYATQGNLNNHIGAPLSLLRITGDHEWAVIELGMNHAGEISLLAGIVRPGSAIITTIAAAHMEFFDDLDGVARAKLEIAEGLPRGAPLYFSASAPGLEIAREVCGQSGTKLRLAGFGNEYADADLCGQSLEVSGRGLRFLWGKDAVQAPGYFAQPMALNLLLAMACLVDQGFDRQRVISAARDLRPATPRRFEVVSASNPVLVDDSYNANPDSFVRALQGLRDMLPDGDLMLLAGEMAELGSLAEEGHRQVGEMAARLGYTFVGVCGGNLAEVIKDGFLAHAPDRAKVAKYRDADEMIEALQGSLDPKLYAGILVKGSRSARMDLVSDFLREGLDA